MMTDGADRQSQELECQQESVKMLEKLSPKSQGNPEYFTNKPKESSIV